MLGIITQLLISWLIICLFEKGNLKVLGFYPTNNRILGFAFFLIVTALCCASDFFMRMLFAEQRWELNPKLTGNLILTGIWWNIKSVLFEELIFRGVLFYILIKKLGATKAIIISSVLFGMYHWFSHEVFADPIPMLITFVTTGTMGLVYAYAYSKTGSLYYPIAIHLGWNLTSSVIFSKSILGDQLFTRVKPVPEVQVGYIVYFSIMLIPMLSAILVNYFLLRKTKQVVF